MVGRMGEERDRRRIGAQPLATTLRFRLLREEFGPEERADARAVRPYIGGEGMGMQFLGGLGVICLGGIAIGGVFLYSLEYSLEYFF